MKRKTYGFLAASIALLLTAGCRGVNTLMGGEGGDGGDAGHATGSIAGTVQAEQADGSAASFDTTLTLAGPTGDASRTVPTKGGSFSVAGLAPGSYQIVPANPGPNLAQASAVSVTVAGGQSAPVAILYRRLPPTIITGDLRLDVLMGPMCPVMRPGESCPDAPVADKPFKITGADGLAHKAVTNQDGVIQIKLPPGRYVVSADYSWMPTCPDTEVHLDGGQFTDATVTCDSGIR